MRLAHLLRIAVIDREVRLCSNLRRPVACSILDVHICQLRRIRLCGLRRLRAASLPRRTCRHGPHEATNERIDAHPDGIRRIVLQRELGIVSILENGFNRAHLVIGRESTEARTGQYLCLDASPERTRHTAPKSVHRARDHAGLRRSLIVNALVLELLRLIDANRSTEDNRCHSDRGRPRGRTNGGGHTVLRQTVRDAVKDLRGHTRFLGIGRVLVANEATVLGSRRVKPRAVLIVAKARRRNDTLQRRLVFKVGCVCALPDGVAHTCVPARLLFHRLNRHLRNGRCDRSGRELLRILSQKNHFAKLTTRMVKGEPSA